MVVQTAGEFIVPMTATTWNKNDEARAQRAELMEEYRPWKMALPPRIGGQQHFGVREEWRPGAGDARRGYERAVAEWWWI
jgi:hypothetical protein